VGYRYDVFGALSDVLGGEWLIGLGFLHPSAHYVSGVPQGNIRNADVGFMNVLMPMGLIGLLVLYAPMVAAAFSLLPRAQDPTNSISRLEWLRFGASAWLVGTIAASVTVGFLHTRSGLVLTAAIVTVGLLAASIDHPQSASKRL
jgi:hypothetical protein